MCVKTQELLATSFVFLVATTTIVNGASTSTAGGPEVCDLTLEDCQKAHAENDIIFDTSCYLLSGVPKDCRSLCDVHFNPDEYHHNRCLYYCSGKFHDNPCEVSTPKPSTSPSPSSTSRPTSTIPGGLTTTIEAVSTSNTSNSMLTSHENLTATEVPTSTISKANRMDSKCLPMIIIAILFLVLTL